MMKVLACLMLLCAPNLVWAQERFQSGELKGFAKSPTEGVMMQLEHPFVVSKVAGTVIRSVGDKSALGDVLIEFRGPGHSETVKATKTADSGEFQIQGLRPGKYVFKATSLGFQSIVGVVIVSRTAPRGPTIRLEMIPGV